MLHPDFWLRLAQDREQEYSADARHARIVLENRLHLADIRVGSGERSACSPRRTKPERRRSVRALLRRRRRESEPASVQGFSAQKADHRRARTGR
jgi:hypothetical protein